MHSHMPLAYYMVLDMLDVCSLCVVVELPITPTSNNPPFPTIVSTLCPWQFVRHTHPPTMGTSSVVPSTHNSYLYHMSDVILQVANQTFWYRVGTSVSYSRGPRFKSVQILDILPDVFRHPLSVHTNSGILCQVIIY
jgi:hypothetical protein